MLPGCRFHARLHSVALDAGTLAGSLLATSTHRAVVARSQIGREHGPHYIHVFSYMTLLLAYSAHPSVISELTPSIPRYYNDDEHVHHR